MRPLSGRTVAIHLAFPAAAPAALVGLYLTPKTAFGCANRGYAALAVVFLGLVVAAWAAGKAAAAKRRGEDDRAGWWMITALILVSPLALLAGPLG